LPGRRLKAQEMEAQAAAAQPVAPAPLLPAGEALAMLARRGFPPELCRPDLRFARDLDGEAAERLGELLRHYSFRLFPARGHRQDIDGHENGPSASSGRGLAPVCSD